MKGDARVWSKEFEENLRVAVPPVILSWENLRDGLEGEFVKIEDPNRVWNEIQGLRQREGEPINEYNKKFSLLWESLCEALQPGTPT